MPKQNSLQAKLFGFRSTLQAGVGIAALLFATAATAASETRELEEFSSISFSLPFEVEFVAADEHYITFEGDQDTIDEIKTKIKGNTLKVYKDNSWFDWSDDEVIVTIGYSELNAIALAGSGDGFAEAIETDDFKISISGSANLEIEHLKADSLRIAIAGSGDVAIVELDVDEVDSTIAGSGDIALSGRVVSQEISISGSGDHDASELRSQETTASVRGSGDVKVWAEARLAVSLVGSGDLQYYGDPDINDRVVGSGSITHLGEAP